MNCRNCPVACGADRQINKGYCGVGRIKIAKYCLYAFEEPPISYKRGSGNVFFSGCALKCRFCQNFDISQDGCGREIEVEELARIFKELEERGAENINLVNPTQFLSEIEEALTLYRPNIPIVYNTHGYETCEALERADKFVDIWLPDLKFMDDFLSKRYTSRPDYAKFALPAIKFMASKPLKMDGGKMLSGCIIRHLVLPMAAYDSKHIVEFVATLSPDVFFSVMSQYTPFGELAGVPELKRRITKREYNMVLDKVEEVGLKRVFIQDFDSANEAYIPNWDF